MGITPTMINNLSVSGHHRRPRRLFVLSILLLIVLCANICQGMPTPDEETFSREVSGSASECDDPTKCCTEFKF